MNAVLKGYLRLARPANLPTAAADIFAGIAVAGVFESPEFSNSLLVSIGVLVLASVCLYAGGVVLNDVFDYKIDQVERPERPIPSGLISRKSATLFGVFLVALGVLFAFYVRPICGIIGSVLAILILLYDGFSKKYDFLGPFNMGLCRSANLLLGIAILGMFDGWEYAIVPLLYIYAITMISRGEVHGNNKKHLIWAGALYALVIFGVLGMHIVRSAGYLESIPFLGLFAFLIYRPLIHAYKANTPANIKKAVIAGVLSLIALDASMAVGFSFWWYGLLILLLLPLSMLLSKLFAVT